MGFYDVWLQQGVGDVVTFLSVFRQRVTDKFQQSRYNEIHLEQYFIRLSLSFVSKTTSKLLQ